MARGPKSHHVVPNPSGGWDVKRGGGERASGHFATKAQAVDRGVKSAAIKARNYASTIWMGASAAATAMGMTPTHRADDALTALCPSIWRLRR